MAWCVHRRWRWLLGVGCLVACSGAALGAGGLTLLAEQPLPVAIRDGLVTQATVRSVPFPSGGAVLDGPTAAALDGFIGAVATDCLLFAQAIGHVRPGADADGDTLAAHRLARIRAEAIRDRLVGAGLPGGAVSTAWDRQFAVREPRVTLWIFSQVPGQDCTGAPLRGAAAPVAEAAPDQPAAPAVANGPSGPASTSPLLVAIAEEPTPEAASADAPVAAAPDGADPAGPVGAPTPAGRAGEMSTTVDMVVEAAAGAAPLAAVAGVPPVPEPELELIRAGAVLRERQDAGNGKAEAPTRHDATAPWSAGVPPEPAGANAQAEAAGPVAALVAITAEPEAGPEAPSAPPAAMSVELVFAPDSDEIGGEDRSRLQAMLDGLVRHGAWEVELLAAVGDRAGNLPADRALAYNRWLAERRQMRVEEWLGTRGDGPVIRIRRTLASHDPSRRLVLTARPLP